MEGKDLLNLSEVLPNDEDLYLEACLTDDQEVVSYVPEYQSSSCIVQALPSNLIVGKQQVILAALLTFESFREGYNVSNKPYIQYLLFFTGTRQIKEALRKIRKLGRAPYVVVRICIGDRKTRINELLNNLHCKLINNWEELNELLDVEAISQLYGLPHTSREDLVKNVLSIIAYSKITMT